MHQKLELNSGTSRYVMSVRPRALIPTKNDLQFQDPNAADRFITRCTLNQAALRRFAMGINGFERWRAAYPQHSISQFISHAIVEGRISLHKAPKTGFTPKSLIKQDNGTFYRFTSHPELGTPSSAAAYTIKAATHLIERLGYSEAERHQLEQTLGLTKQNLTLTQAIANGTIRVVEERKQQTTEAQAETIQTKAVDKPAVEQPSPSSEKQTAAANNQPEQEGQAKALEKAAEAGTPFCEECGEETNE